ncbi:MAG: hypothetical protein MJZ38_05750, partial [archaeon]|nr:hypothetical protein [archaeon]
MQIGSYKRFSTTRNDYGYFTPIDIDLSFDSLDRAILQLETLYITSYAWRTYSDSILNTDTLIDSTGDRVRERYYVGKSIDKGYLPDPGSEETDHLARGMRKASDVLAIVEFYLNRVHSLSRDNIKDQMVVARRYIRSRWKAASGQTKSEKKDGSEFDVGQLKTITKYSKDENDHQNATFSFNSKSEPQFIRETLEGKVDGAYPLAQFDRIGLRWVEKDGELVAVPLDAHPLYAIDSPPDTLPFADLFLKLPTAQEPNP